MGTESVSTTKVEFNGNSADGVGAMALPEQGRSPSAVGLRAREQLLFTAVTATTGTGGLHRHLGGLGQPAPGRRPHSGYCPAWPAKQSQAVATIRMTTEVQPQKERQEAPGNAGEYQKLRRALPEARIEQAHGEARRAVAIGNRQVTPVIA